MTTFLMVTACTSGGPAVTPPIVPGTGAAPREVNVINGGLDVHEAIIGDATVQDAWEAAEAAAADAPPGPTPAVSVPPDLEGLRIVVESGQRVDIVWTVPSTSEPLVVGCHIPGHWDEGMHIPVRFVGGMQPS